MHFFHFEQSALLTFSLKPELWSTLLCKFAWESIDLKANTEKAFRCFIPLSIFNSKMELRKDNNFEALLACSRDKITDEANAPYLINGTRWVLRSNQIRKLQEWTPTLQAAALRDVDGISSSFPLATDDGHSFVLLCWYALLRAGYIILPIVIQIGGMI